MILKNRSMPTTNVIFYQEAAGESPVVEWLTNLNETNPRAFDKCRAAIARLAVLGHELRRPEADYLGDGIYELRLRLGSVNYCLLYFFHSRAVSVVAHGLTKESEVPAIEIKRAIVRKAAFTANPAAHTFRGEINDA
jgi:phage-related protein